MTPSVASVQRLAFFSLRIPDSELGCDVGSARDPIKREVARLRSVAFSSSTMHDRDEIWVAKDRRRAGDGQATAAARIGDGPDSPGRLTKNRTLAQPPHGKAQFGRSEARRTRLSVRTRAQNALFRHVAAPGRCGATPPPGCGALWRMSQLGKCARATPRQAAGWVARGFANLGLESGLTERRTLPNQWAPECAFP